MFRSTKSFILPVLGVIAVIPALGLAILEMDRPTAPRQPAAKLQSNPGVASVSVAAATDVLIDRPVQGTGKIEAEIVRIQQGLGSSRSRVGSLERLGWLFVAKARKDGDAGFYLRARACAEAMETADPTKHLDSLLLRGHIHHQLHQFSEAEAIARELVANRGNPFDYAMLGDALFDRGDLDGATAAYQKLMELRPGLPAYLRAGEMRWLHGEVEGCLDVMLMAVLADRRDNRKRKRGRSAGSLISSCSRIVSKSPKLRPNERFIWSQAISLLCPPKLAC